MESVRSLGGIEYRIIRTGRKTLALEVGSKGVIVRSPYGIGDEEIDSFVSSKLGWIKTKLQAAKRRNEEVERNLKVLSDDDIKELTRKAEMVIPPRVERFAKKIGVTYGKITIRHQKTRWGSCTASGNLNFNCLLLLMPEEVMDSVIVHELCHRLEMNHSRRFYEHVYAAFPDYDRCSRWLKKNGPAIIRKITG